jgi:hypothetical protein
MNRRLRLAGWVAGLLVLAGPLTAALTFEPGEYAARRGRLMEKIGDGAAVFLGASTPASDVAFRQGHDFVYLTGVRVPDACLVVDGQRQESVLFFTMSEAEAESEGIPPELVRNPKDITAPSSPACASGPGSSMPCSSLRRSDRRTPTRSSIRSKGR